MATTSLTLTADSRLSEDYLQTNDILVLQTSPSPVAPVLMPDGSTNALVVIQGQGLQELFPATSSQSGWALAPIPSGQKALEVVAGTDAAGVMHAFFQDGAQTYHTSLGADGQWAPPDVFSPAANLGVANVPLTGELVAFGFTPDGNLLLVRANPTTGVWEGKSVDFQHGLNGAQGVLQMVDADNWLLAVNNGGTLQYFTGKAFAYASGPQTVSTTNMVARVHFAYYHQNSTMLLFSDTQNQLFTTVGFSDQIQAIPGALVKQGAGVVDLYENLVRFYATDPSGNLWILHQTGWDSNQAPTWAPIFPLDTDVSQVAAPLALQDGTDLFAVGLDLTLHTLTQDPDTMLWTRQMAQMPGNTPQPYYLRRYRTQINLFDQNQLPTANVAVTVNADAEMAVLINGTTYFIGPDADQAATVTTDTTGLFTITATATGLSATPYTITAPGLTGAERVFPDQNYRNFLSGTAGINTGSATVAPMSGETLMNASVGGQPLSPNLTPDLAATASQGIISAMQAGTQSPQAAAGAGWALDLRDRSNPKFIRFQNELELQAHRTALAATVSASSAWDQISDFFGDVWHAVKSGAMKVVHWVVDTANKVVSMAVKIGEEIVQLSDMVIHGIEEAISIVHSIFNYLEAAVERVIDWLKDLFSTADIWATKQVFEHLFLQTMPALEYLVGQKVRGQVDGLFKELKSTVDGTFQSAANYLEGQSIGQMISPSKPQLAARGHRLAAGAGLPTSSAAQNNWLQSKVTENVSGSVLDSLSTTLPSDLTSQLMTTLADSNLLQDLEGALTNLGDFFKQIWDDPRSLPTKGAADLVRAAGAVVDFAIDLMMTLIDMLLEIVTAVFAAAQSLLTQPLGDIPVVTWLYQHIFSPDGEEPTMIGLCSLLLALPVTLLYKLANGNQAPFSQELVTEILSWQFQAPTRTNAAAALMEGAGAQAGNPGWTLDKGLQNWLVRALSVMQACGDMAVDGFSQTDDGPASTWTKASAWTDLVVTGLMQLLTWPGGFPDVADWDWTSSDPAAQLPQAAWLTGWLPVGLNFALLTLPLPSVGSVAEGIDSWGKTALIVLGATTMGLGLTGSIIGLNEQPPTANGYNVATSILGPLPNICQFLRYNDVVDGSDGVTLGVKLVINDIADVATGILSGMAM